MPVFRKFYVGRGPLVIGMYLSSVEEFYSRGGSIQEAGHKVAQTIVVVLTNK